MPEWYNWRQILQRPGQETSTIGDKPNEYSYQLEVPEFKIPTVTNSEYSIEKGLATRKARDVYDAAYKEYLEQHPSQTSVGYNPYIGTQYNPEVQRQQAAHLYAQNKSGYYASDPTAPYKESDRKFAKFSEGVLGTMLFAPELAYGLGGAALRIGGGMAGGAVGGYVGSEAGKALDNTFKTNFWQPTLGTVGGLWGWGKGARLGYNAGLKGIQFGASKGFVPHDWVASQHMKLDALRDVGLNWGPVATKVATDNNSTVVSQTGVPASKPLQINEPTIKLYRATGTSGNFTPSPDGTAEFAGQWFTNDPDKVWWYGENALKSARRAGVENPIELQVVDVPKSQLESYRASNIIKDRSDIEFEPEDFLIPLSMPRKRTPLNLTGNIFADMRVGLPQIDRLPYQTPKVFRGFETQKSFASDIPVITRENAASITDAQWDAAYNEAIRSGNIAEAQRLRDLHFVTKTPDNRLIDGNNNPHLVWHGSPENWTVFDDWKRGTEDVIYFSTDKSYADQFTIPRKNWKVGMIPNKSSRSFYLYGKNPLDIGTDMDSQLVQETMRSAWLNGENPDSVYGLDAWAPNMPLRQSNGIELGVLRRNQMKLSDPITYNDSGQIIPLSKRDDFGNPDIRYSLNYDLPREQIPLWKRMPQIMRVAQSDLEKMNPYHVLNVEEYNKTFGKSLKAIPFRTNIGGSKLLSRKDFIEHLKQTRNNGPSDNLERVGGIYDIVNDQVVLPTDAPSSGAYHEFLHQGMYGERNPQVTRWRIGQLLDPEKIKHLNPRQLAYVTSELESPVYFRQNGENLGIKVGDYYPGDEVFDKLLEEKGLFGSPVYAKRNTSEEKQLFWRALNGTLFGTIPLIGLSRLPQKEKQGGIIKGQNGFLNTWQKAYNSKFGKGLRDFMFGKDNDLSDEEYLEKYGYNKPVGGIGILGALVAPEWEGLEIPEITAQHIGNQGKVLRWLESGNSKMLKVPVKETSKKVSNWQKFLKLSQQEQDDFVRRWNGESFQGFATLKGDEKALNRFRSWINSRK